MILPGLKFASGRGARSGTLPLITDVLSAIDHFLISGNAPSPDFTLSRLARVRTLLERALFELLVRNESPDALRMEMPEGVRREWQHMAELGLLPQRPLDQHSELLRSAEWIMDLARVEEGVTLISTNYDIEVEQGLYANSTIITCSRKSTLGHGYVTHPGQVRSIIDQVIHPIGSSNCTDRSIGFVAACATTFI